MALVDLVAELTGTLQGLSPLLARKHIQRAWLDIQRERRWSCLGVDGVVVCPDQITSGTFALTQYATTVVADATASAALTPYITGTPLLTQLQIRFGGSIAASPVYRIMAVDASVPAALVLTLDRIVVEATAATATYQCYRAYITPPQENFLAWNAIVNLSNGYRLNLDWTSVNFDARDPQRTSTGIAYYCGFFRTAGPYGALNTPDSNQNQGAPIYELWPHQTSSQAFYVRFQQKQWQLIQPFDTQPASIDDQLILARAYGWYSYQFAQANASNFPAFKMSQWPTLIAVAKAEYRQLLMSAKRNDDAQALQTVWNRGHGLRGGTGNLPYPIDAAYIQAHFVPL